MEVFFKSISCVSCMTGNSTRQGIQASSGEDSVSDGNHGAPAHESYFSLRPVYADSGFHRSQSRVVLLRPFEEE